MYENSSPDGGTVGVAAAESTAAAATTTCDFCSEAVAVVYCRADSAALCLGCDRHVHSANTVSSRHHRSLLCSTCRAAPAAFVTSSSPSSLLCPNCDFDARGNDDSVEKELDRRSIEPFTGCPSAIELVSLLGVGGEEKKVVAAGAGSLSAAAAADKGVWETPTQVLSWEDLIVPTTYNHGFQALGVLPLPKKRKPILDENGGEIMRQLHGLMKSESPVSNTPDELEPLLDFQSTIPSHVEELMFGFNHEAIKCSDVSTFEVNAHQWNLNNSHEAAVPVGHTYEQYMGSSYAVDASVNDDFIDAHGSGDGIAFDGVEVSCPTNKERNWLFPSGGSHEFVCVDRNTVISRYKEKRKARRYDKMVRYESRKARADSRVRVKGRFAKISEAPRY